MKPETPLPKPPPMAYTAVYPSTMGELGSACRRKAGREYDLSVPDVVPTAAAMAELVEKFMELRYMVGELARRLEPGAYWNGMEWAKSVRDE